MKLVITLALIGAVAAGCAANPESKAPTHRWASTSVANEVEYRNDHARCQSQADIKDASALSTNSDAFAAYKQCMVSSGYELTAYRD